VTACSQAPLHLRAEQQVRDESHHARHLF
jgi:hypothetical protein